jgi:hypothetical protein
MPEMEAGVTDPLWSVEELIAEQLAAQTRHEGNYISRMKFRHVIALFAGLGLFAPAAVLFVGGYLDWGGDWLIVFWPTALTLIGDRFRPPTWFEVISEWTVAIGINVLLYAIVGMVVWGTVAIAGQLRPKSN